MAAGMEAQYYLGARRTFDTEALGPDGNATIGTRGGQNPRKGGLHFTAQSPESLGDGTVPPKQKKLLGEAAGDKKHALETEAQNAG